MLLAESMDWAKLLDDKGLAVVLVAVAVLGMWRTASCLAPLAKEYVSSTVELNETTKTAVMAQTALLEEHSSRLSDIKRTIKDSRCPMIGTDARELRADARDYRADSRDHRADQRDDRADMRSHDATGRDPLPHGV